MDIDIGPVIDSGTAFSLAGLVYLISAVAASVHVLLNKQNVSAAFSWIGVIVLSPFFGVLLYWLFGINRIRRRAQAEMRGRADLETDAKQPQPIAPAIELTHLSDAQLQLLHAGLAIHDSPYLSGNQIDVLLNGVEAFPRMLNAIDGAKKSVVLSSYIFEYDAIGKQFVAALIKAHERGVPVYVLIDGVGVGYGLSLVRADRVLRKNNVSTARFLPTVSASGFRFMNLRNHRKILCIDGRCAFVGGMNIRAGNLLDANHRHQTQDVHFCIQGPAINQINRVFEEDWLFATGQTISLSEFRGTSSKNVTCRVLVDGPDDNYKKLELTLIAAINAARKTLTIATPYFLPDQAVISALRLAVMRGVDVRVLIPSKSNLAVVDWAMCANESSLLNAGIKIYRSQPPFDHSKLFVVDGSWSLIGSSNWDARSLELNFEINVECFDEAFAQKLDQVFGAKFKKAELVSDVSRSLPVRLRNNFFRLFTPYL